MKVGGPDEAQRGKEWHRDYSFLLGLRLNLDVCILSFQGYRRARGGKWL